MTTKLEDQLAAALRGCEQMLRSIADAKGLAFECLGPADAALAAYEEALRKEWLKHLIGKRPGDETDEEVAGALRKVQDKPRTMADVKPGDWVECLADYGDEVRKGDRFRVLRAEPLWGLVWVHPEDENGWLVDRFRPCDPPKEGAAFESQSASSVRERLGFPASTDESQDRVLNENLDALTRPCDPPNNNDEGK